MASLSDDRLRKLKDSISKTGFPLELEIGEILASRNYYTSPNIHYLDDETGKDRELDNFALFPAAKSHEFDPDPVRFSPHIAVECKRLGDVSVAVFARNRLVVTTFDFSGQMYDFPRLILHKPPPVDLTREFDLGWTISRSELHYNEFAPRIGIAKGIKPGSEPLGEDEEKKKDPVYSGVMQLVKAQIHDVRSAIARDKEIAYSYYPFYFSFLVLVVEGALVEVKGKGASLDLRQVDHAVARTSFKASYDDNFQGYLIDVVTKDHFSRFLDVLESDVGKLASALEKQKDRLSEYMRRPSNVF